MSEQWWDEHGMDVFLIGFCVIIVTVLWLAVLFPGPQEGVIYEKNFRAEHWFYIMHNSDSWTFLIKKDGKKGCVEVTEEEYKQYQVGDYYKKKKREEK